MFLGSPLGNVVTQASRSNPFRPYPIGCLQLLLPESGAEEALRSGSLTLLQRSGLVTAFPVQLSLVSFPPSLSL